MFVQTILSSPRRRTRISVLGFAGLFTCLAASAASVRLQWDPNPSGTTAAYKVVRGSSSGNYDTSLEVGQNSTADMPGLTAGQTYYFAVVARNSGGQESSPSNEISHKVPATVTDPPPQPPTPPPAPDPVPETGLLAALPMSVSTPKDTPVATTLSGNHPTGGTLSYRVMTWPIRGKLSGTPPKLTYTPNAGFTGSDVFEFRVGDGKTVSANAKVSIGIGTAAPPVTSPPPVTAPPPVTTPPPTTTGNRAPVATSISVTVPKGTRTPITLLGKDADGDALSYRIMNSPINGSLSGTPPYMSYTPKSGFTGKDSFEFRVKDAKVLSANALVSISVVSGTKTLSSEAATIIVLQGGTSESLTAPATISVLSDPSGVGSPASLALVREPAYGTVEEQPDGSYAYRHFGGLELTDEFTYVTTSESGESTETVVDVRILEIVDVQAVNDDVELEFSATAGYSYEIEFQEVTSETPDSWEVLTTYFASEDGIVTYTDFGGVWFERTYRVRCVGTATELVTPPWGLDGQAEEEEPAHSETPGDGIVVREALVLALGEGEVELSGDGWGIGELDAKDGFASHVVVIVASGENENVGNWLPILNNTDRVLSLSDAGGETVASLRAGDQVEVRRLPSAADIFGVAGATSTLLPGEVVTVSEADGVPIWTLESMIGRDGSVGYYIDTGTGSREGPFDGTSLTFAPGQEFTRGIQFTAEDLGAEAGASTVVLNP